MSQLKNFYEVKNTPNGTTKAGVPYSDFSNGEFAHRMWQNHKENAETLDETMPLGVWADSVGLNDDDFDAVFKIAMGENFTPPKEVPTEWTANFEDKARLTNQGQTFGWGEEITAAMGATADVISGRAGEESFGDLYTNYRDAERAKIAEYRTNDPMGALKYEIAGAVFSPAGIFKAPKLIKQLSATKQAAITGGTVGTIYGAGSSNEDSASGVATDALITGVSTSLFGVGLQKVIPLVGNKVKNFKLKNLFTKNAVNPTLETLKEAKDTAYDIVKQSYGLFDNVDFTSMASKANKIAVENHHTATKDVGITAALNVFKSLKPGTKSYTLMQMEKVKQTISKLYKKHPEQTALIEMMDLVDDTIRAKNPAQANELSASRAAASLYKKAEKLSQAFDNVKNMKNAQPGLSNVEIYKTAVANLLKDTKAMKYWSAEEQQLLGEFIKGGVAERTLARTAKLGFSFNSLLGSIVLSTQFMHPAVLIPLGVGLVSKQIIDPMIKRKANELVNTVSQIPKPSLVPALTQMSGATSAVVGDQK
tara:strand:- start:40 stop:1647 length:1608 start_codon:yes stop_codon:yes gene_type:complete